MNMTRLPGHGYPLLYLCCAWFLSIAANAQTPISADSNSPEAVLSALKHALVDAAHQETVNVISSAYIDSSGQLVESAFFGTQTTVRGVRVQEYLPAPEEAPFEYAALLPAGLMQAREGSCAIHALNQYPNTLLVSLHTDLGQGRINNGDEQIIKQRVRELVSSHSAITAQWVVVHRDELAGGLGHYDRLLTGLRSFENADYELRWTLNKIPPASTGGLISQLRQESADAMRSLVDRARAAGRYVAKTNPLLPIDMPGIDPAITLYHHLALVDRRTQAALHVRSFETKLSAEDSFLRRSAEQLAWEATDSLATQLAQFLEELASKHDCQLRQFAVEPATGAQALDGSELLIRIGEANQARVGDRFLLIETPWQGGQQTLNSNLVSTLSIGEIVHVEQFQSTIRLIAGNGPAHTLKYALPF